MLTRPMLDVQLQLYQNAQMRAMDELEKAKANLAACGGAIEACNGLHKLLTDLEQAGPNTEAAIDAAEENDNAKLHGTE